MESTAALLFHSLSYFKLDNAQHFLSYLMCVSLSLAVAADLKKKVLNENLLLENEKYQKLGEGKNFNQN